MGTGLYAVAACPNLKFRFTEGEAGRWHEMATVIFDQIAATSPVLRIFQRVQWADRFPAMMRVAVDFYPDVTSSCCTHPLGIFDCQIGWRVIVVLGQHQENRSARCSG